VIASRKTVIKFVLTPLSPGSLKPDTGEVIWGQAKEHFIVRDRRRVEIDDVDATLFGRRGTLAVHAKLEWTHSGNGYFVGTGRLTVLHGTRAYAGLVAELSASSSWLPSGPATWRWDGFVYAK
jgi:hypothetical protein